VPRLCEFYPGICLATEEKAQKNLSQVKKNLSQSTVYILPKHPHIKNPHKHTITKPTHTHTSTHTHTHTYYKPHTYARKHTHTLQNNIKPPQYKLKQNAIGEATQLGERTLTEFLTVYCVGRCISAVSNIAKHDWMYGNIKKFRSV
jgi:hypothetical protein